MIHQETFQMKVKSITYLVIDMIPLKDGIFMINFWPIYQTNSEYDEFISLTNMNISKESIDTYVNWQNQNLEKVKNIIK